MRFGRFLTRIEGSMGAHVKYALTGILMGIFHGEYLWHEFLNVIQV